MILHFPSQFPYFFRRALLLSLFAASAIFILTFSAAAQKRDNLTNEEDLLVREAQQIDARMTIFTKVIDRRFLALSGANAAQNKEEQKNSEAWGELRMGTNAELFFDIQKTLDEAIKRIDDIAEKDQQNPLFPKAVHILADACGRYIPQLKNFQVKFSASGEGVLIANSVEACSQIVEASVKVPRETGKDRKKKNRD